MPLKNWPYNHWMYHLLSLTTDIHMTTQLNGKQQTENEPSDCKFVNEDKK